MSTRCRVGAETESGIRSIHIHWDGYVEGVGALLEQHWTDPAQLMLLIKQGDLDSIGPDLEALGRLPSYQAPLVSKDREAFRELTKAQGAHFAYLRTPQGWVGKQLGWNYISPGDDTRYWADDSPWLPLAALARWEPEDQQAPA